MLRLVASSFHRCTAADQERVAAALDRVNTTVNSPEFAEALLARRGLTYTKGLDNQQILDTLLTGTVNPSAEQKVAEHAIAFDYWLEPPRAGATIGYTDADGVHTYADFFEHATPAELAGHLAHEAVGHLDGGFRHPMFNLFGRRDRSVPYAVGEIVLDLDESKLGEPIVKTGT